MRKNNNSLSINTHNNTPELSDIYSAIFQQTMIAIAIYDSGRNLIDVNTEYLKLFGVSSIAELKDISLFDNLNIPDNCKNKLLKGESVQFETNYNFDSAKSDLLLKKTKSGIINISVEIKPIFHENNNITGYLLLVKDITESKKTLDSLLESEERYKSAFMNHCAVKLIIDPDTGQIIDANKAAENFYGWSIEELKKMKIQNINTLTEEEVFKEMQNARNNKRTHFHFKHRLSSGIIKDVEVFSGKIKIQGKDFLHSIIHDISDKVQSEERQRTLAEMLDIAPCSITIHDFQGNFLFANQKTYLWHGYTEDEFMHINLHELDAPDSGIHIEERMRLVDKMGESRFEVSHYRKDGSIFPLEVYTKKIEWKGIPSILSIATDITERKIFEEKLNESKQYFSVIGQIAKIGGWELYPETMEIRWSEETYRIHEIDPETKPSIDEALNFWHPDDRPILVSSIKNAIEKGIPYDLELRFITAKGKNLYARTKCNPVIKNGKVIKLQGYLHDITESKKAQITLENEKEWLTVTLKSIGDGVITTDIKANVILINNLAEKLTGWTQEQAQGENLNKIFNIVNEVTHEPYENPVQKVLSSGETMELTEHTILIARDGTEKLISLSSAPIKGKDGNIIGVVLVFRDITEKQRFLEMAQNSQKLESLGILAGGIAHDFNNLLGGIYGYIEMAVEEYETQDTIRQYLAKAMSTIDRARDLTRQLLTFVKGGAPLQKANALFPFVQETVQFVLSGSNVTCTYDIPDDLWLCNYDKNQIGQVIDNIIINAVQAMPLGGTISISAQNIIIGEKEHPLLSKGDYVCISIMDSGIGIPREILTRIFDPFFTTKAKGHGLGLSTCYSIMKRHGGAIEADSKFGKGSIFKLYLPAVKEIKPLVDTKSPVKHKGSGRILVMDDEEIIREILSKILKSLGYDVICKNNGNEAIEYFTSELKSNRSLSAMIFDLTVIGGMSGLEAVKEVRKLDNEIPIFVASGYADAPVMENPAEYGFTASICKPFRKSELMEMLEKYIKK